MKYNKFRELKVNVFDIPFENFHVKEILNYMPAGNDVLEVLTEDNKNYFVKIERSKVADFEAEYKNINALKELGYSHVPNVIEFINSADYKCLVLDKISGDRLSNIITSDTKENYLLDLGKELANIHLVNPNSFNIAKQRVINDIPTEDTYSFDNSVKKYVDYLKDNNYKKEMNTFIHGDFHYANVLWEDKTINGVLDWEYSGKGHKEQDIAWALVVRPGQKFLNSIDDFKVFLKGYKEKQNYDSLKLKWCLVNAYLHFYLINNDKDYKNLLLQLMDLIINTDF